MAKLLETILKMRVLVVLALCGVIVWGVRSYIDIPRDAFPDISPVMVPVFCEADGLAALKAAAVDNSVLELKKYEALVNMSNGTASKIIIPTDAVNTVTNNTIFSETTGIGDVTKPAEKPKEKPKADPCCD